VIEEEEELEGEKIVDGRFRLMQTEDLILQKCKTTKNIPTSGSPLSAASCTNKVFIFTKNTPNCPQVQAPSTTLTVIPQSSDFSSAPSSNLNFQTSKVKLSNQR
jgi:hypothetical protein